ncbi:MAG: MFS transporter [Deltaproteobacteria bacterium]
MQSDHDMSPGKGRFIILGILFITLMIAYVDRVNISVLIADPGFIADMDLKAQAARQGMLMTLFLLAYALGNIILGYFGDRLGPRKAVSVSIVLWSAALFIAGNARNLVTLIGARIFMGFGEGFHWPMQSTYVKNWFPLHERARANSAWTVGLMVGPAIAMPLCSAIIANWGWASSFIILGITALVVPLPLIWFYTADRPREHRMVSDAEASYIEQGQQEEQAALAEVQPGSYKDLLHSGRFWLVTIGYMATASIWWGTMTWLPQYLKVARHFSWSQMGMFSSLPYILGTISVLLIAYISDKLNRRGIFYTLGLLGAVVFIYLGATTSSNFNSAIFIAIAIFFLGWVMPVAWTLLQTLVAPNLVGAAAGLMNGIANGFAAFAPTIMGYLIGQTGSYLAGMVYLMVVGLIGSACTAVFAVKRY